MASPTQTDTTSVPITGKDGTAGFTLDNGIYTVNYNVLLDMFRVREVNEMFNTDRFSIEGQADQEAGRSQLVGELAGMCGKHGPASGPLIPAPQDVSCVMQYSAGCTISASVNMPEASCDRLVNQNCRIGGRFISKLTYAVVWVRT